MASPQFSDPGGPQRDHGDRQNAAVERRSRPRRGGFVYWWWGFWIVILVFALGWGIWGSFDGNGWWFIGRHSEAAHAPAMNGQGVPVINTQNKLAFVGQKITVHFVPVIKKISDTVFWVGSKNGVPTLLVLSHPNPGKNGVIDKGTLVDITGTVQKAPPQAQAQKQWALNSGDAAQLERQGGYIQGTDVFWVPS